MVERRTENPCVASSILALGTIKNIPTKGCFLLERTRSFLVLTLIPRCHTEGLAPPVLSLTRSIPYHVTCPTKNSPKRRVSLLERVRGIEPLSAGWKPAVITTIRHPHRDFRNSLVGATGLEPATSWSQTRRSSHLSYTPTRETRILLFSGDGILAETKEKAKPL